MSQEAKELLKKAEYNRETKSAEAKAVSGAARTKRAELNDLERILARCAPHMWSFSLKPPSTWACMHCHVKGDARRCAQQGVGLQHVNEHFVLLSQSLCFIVGMRRVKGCTA